MDYYPHPRPVLYGTTVEESSAQTQTAPIRVGPPRYPPAPPLAGDFPEPFGNSNRRSRSYAEYYARPASFRRPLIVLCAVAAVYASLQLVLGTTGFANPVLGGIVLVGEITLVLVVMASLGWMGGREYMLALGSCFVLVSLGVILGEWQSPVLWIAIVILILLLRRRMWHYYFLRARQEVRGGLGNPTQRSLGWYRNDARRSNNRLSRGSASTEDPWRGRMFW